MRPVTKAIGSEDGRAADFVHRARDDAGKPAAVQPGSAVDVLHHHDRIVDQDPDRENEREERHAIQREAPGPRGEERGREREQHRDADDCRLAHAEREKHEHHHRKGGKDELVHELRCFLVGSRAVVARDAHLDSGRNDAAAKLVHAAEQPLCDAHRVLAGLFGDLQRHRRVLARGRADPDVARRLLRAIDHLGHVRQEHRPGVAHAEHDVRHVLRRLEEASGFDADRSVVAHQAAARGGNVGELERAAYFQRGDAVRVQPVRIEQNAQRPSRAAERLHFARAGNALELRFCAVRDALELVGAALRIGGPQRERHDRHVVYAFRLHDRLAHAHLGRHPVAVRLNGVVQAHQRLGARHAHLELHGEHRHARARYGEDMLHAAHLREHLLGRDRYEGLHVARRRPGKRHEHVRHGDVDLGLLLARRDRHREQAEEKSNQREERREPGVLEEPGDAPRDAHVSAARP
jgi:hypothetical protein